MTQQQRLQITQLLLAIVETRSTESVLASATLVRRHTLPIPPYA